MKLFQSTLPVWGATTGKRRIIFVTNNFNPRSPCGERRVAFEKDGKYYEISIHAPRVGSDVGRRKTNGEKKIISIHAPRVGSDLQPTATHRSHDIISIHAPRVGSDDRERLTSRRQKKFQSTLPVWGATFPIGIYDYFIFISIHAPRVGSDVLPLERSYGVSISIHAPRVGSDDSKSP